MNNKEELEKYKKELANLEAKDKQQKPKSAMDDIVQKRREEEKRASDKNLKWMIIATIFLVPLAGIFIAFLIFPGLIIPVGMALTDDPNNFKFPLPYNGIDFKKISYINNQFIMYGVDHGAKKNETSLVIFNSTDGKSWTKSVIENSSNEMKMLDSTITGKFVYFKSDCYLLGVTKEPLMATGACNNWHQYKTNLLWQDDRHILIHGATAIGNSMFITVESGIYSTIDGLSWKHESVPCAIIERKCREVGSFGSIASGNNKVIAATMWESPEGNDYGLIYTKDLSTNKWTYVTNPTGLWNLTRGKDRFVGTSEHNAWVLADDNNKWESSMLTSRPFDMSYGLTGFFIGITPIYASRRGYDWDNLMTHNKELWGTSSIACSEKQCVTVGNNYQLILIADIDDWSIVEFDHKNPKPAWYKRFFN